MKRYKGLDKSEMKTTMRIKQEEWTIPQFIYLILLGSLLLDYMVIQAFDRELYSFPAVIALARIAVSVMGICLGRLWRDKGFWLLSALMVIQIVRVAFINGQLFFYDSVNDSIINGIWAISGCYALGKVLSAKKVKAFLRILLVAWAIGMLIHCTIALYAAWNDLRIQNLSGGSIWGIPLSNWGSEWPDRLSVGYVYSTIAGSTLSLSGVLALIGLLAEPKKWIKAIYGLALLIIVIALSLTDSRTSIISLAAGMGVITCSSVLWLIWKKRKTNDQENRGEHGRPWIAWVTAIACMILVFVVSTLAIMKIVPIFNTMKVRGQLIVASAQAEETEPIKQQVVSRGLSGIDVLSGRGEIWEKVLKFITGSRKRLLFGESIYNPMETLNQETGSTMGHCHNMLLQILLESGIVGLLPVLLFGIYSAKNAFRIINSKISPLWLRIIPAIPASVLVGDLAECFGWFRQWKVPALAFMFIAFGIINAHDDRKINHQEEYLA